MGHHVGAWELCSLSCGSSVPRLSRRISPQDARQCAGCCGHPKISKNQSRSSLLVLAVVAVSSVVTVGEDGGMYKLLTARTFQDSMWRVTTSPPPPRARLLIGPTRQLTLSSSVRIRYYPVILPTCIAVCLLSCSVFIGIIRSRSESAYRLPSPLPSKVPDYVGIKHNYCSLEAMPTSTKVISFMGSKDPVGSVSCAFSRPEVLDRLLGYRREVS